uniref:Uncharacterized protein n=1 Tax=Meloidogyne javanica TaxID=6303 RepID=A0A915LSF8_MELJA
MRARKKQRKKRNKKAKKIKQNNVEEDNQNQEIVEEINDEDLDLDGKLVHKNSNELDKDNYINEDIEEDDWKINKKDEKKMRKEEKMKIKHEENLRKLKIKEEDDIKSLLALNNSKKMDLKYYLKNKDMTLKNIPEKERIEELNEENNEDFKLKVDKNQDLGRERVEDVKEERHENLRDGKIEILEKEKVEYLEEKNKDMEDKRELNEANKHLMRPEDQNLLSKNQNKEKIEEDNELLPVNEDITKGNPRDIKSFPKFTPFHPKMFLEEKVLLEAYEKFIGGKGDPKKIIPALEIGVIINEIKQRFDYIKKYKQNKIEKVINCVENKNPTRIFFGSLEAQIYEQNSQKRQNKYSLEDNFNKVLGNNDNIIDDFEKFKVLKNKLHLLALIITKRRWDQMRQKQQKRILFSLLSKYFVESRFIQLYKIKENQLKMIESNKQMSKIKELPIFEELPYFYVQKLHAANALMNQINSSTSVNNNIHYDINYVVSTIKRWASFSKCYYIELLLTGSQLLKTDISDSDVDAIVVLSRKDKDGCGINILTQFYGNRNNDL